MHADSICTRKKLDVNSAKLEFSFDNTADDVFVLQNGFYRFSGSGRRGLGKLGTREIEHLDTFEKDGRLYYRFITNRNHKLRSIIQNRIRDIGKIKSETREFNLNADRKRCWLGRIESMDDRMMNESVSLSLNFLKLNEC